MGFWRKLREILDVTPLSRKMMDVGTFAGERLVQEIEDNAEIIRKERDNMTKKQEKIRLIKDESLGGVKRECVEVERKAEVGDLVYYACDDRLAIVVSDEVSNGSGLVNGGETYLSTALELSARPLEPTDIVHIDGSRFRIVDRKAEVGERVIIVNGSDNCPFENGHVTEVIGSREESISVQPAANLYHSEYRVLVPVENETSPESIVDIIANLTRRMAELERREESQRRINGVLSQRINAMHRDIETWAQEVEKMKRELDDKIEMCIDDIVTLDERSQPKDITISVADLAKLIGGARG